MFAEVGYSWVIHDTYHLTFGVGIRRIVYLGIRDDSPLRDPDVDQDFLAEGTDRVPRWIPIAALRFSRAF